LTTEPEPHLPPHDLDAEEAVLGSVLLDPQALAGIPFLKPDDFYRDKNRWVWEAFHALTERGESLNQITVGQELARQGRLEGLGGPAYLAGLIANTPTSVHLKGYAQITYRLATMRRLIGAARQIEGLGYAAAPDTTATMDQAEDILFQVHREHRQRDFTPLRQVLTQYLEEAEPALDGGDHPAGALIPTGFADLDHLLGGLHRSDMVVLAARPGLGKTSLALNIARNAALDFGARVGIFSLEMARLELAYRFLAAESGVDSQRIRLGHMTPEQRDAVSEAVGNLSEAAIYIDDSADLGETDMRSKARRLYLEAGGLDLLIVDYIQLMHGSRKGRQDNRAQEVSDISQAIKGLARDLEVPVIAVSQLSRAVEQRSPKIPQLSDLRESGSIEQDADIVMFIYREDVYTPREEWERLRPGEPYPRGIAQVHVAKHRNGPQGRVSLYFQEKLTKFVDLAVLP